MSYVYITFSISYRYECSFLDCCLPSCCPNPRARPVCGEWIRTKKMCRSLFLLADAGLSAARLFCCKRHQHTRRAAFAALEPSNGSGLGRVRVGVRVRVGSGLGFFRGDVRSLMKTTGVLQDVFCRFALQTEGAVIVIIREVLIAKPPCETSRLSCMIAPPAV